MVEAAPPQLVRSKVMETRLFCPGRKLSGNDARWIGCLNGAAPGDEHLDQSFPEVNTEKVRKTQALAGTSQLANQAIFVVKRTGSAIRRSFSSVEGQRKRQEHSRFSSKFNSLIPLRLSTNFQRDTHSFNS